MEPRPLSELLFAIEAGETHERQLRKARSEAVASLRAARLSVGISQTKLADALGRTPGYVSQVENGSKGVTPSKLREFYGALAAASETKEGRDGDEDE